MTPLSSFAQFAVKRKPFPAWVVVQFESRSAQRQVAQLSLCGVVGFSGFYLGAPSAKTSVIISIRGCSECVPSRESRESRYSLFVHCDWRFVWICGTVGLL